MELAYRLKTAVFWGAAACTLIVMNRRLKNACSLHHEADECPDDGNSK